MVQSSLVFSSCLFLSIISNYNSLLRLFRSRFWAHPNRSPQQKTWTSRTSLNGWWLMIFSTDAVKVSRWIFENFWRFLLGFEAQVIKEKCYPNERRGKKQRHKKNANCKIWLHTSAENFWFINTVVWVATTDFLLIRKLRACCVYF